VKPPSPGEIEAALGRITDRLVAWGARKVIVFGSVARGDYTAASDIDLVIVRPISGRMPSRISEALGPCWEADPPLPVEPLVYTPEEYDRLLADGNPLLREVTRHGRVLHDAA
jgi:predicted nucleotidyltransferase